jgi:RNA polymerase sigma-70 factor (ECF subfamily)
MESVTDWERIVREHGPMVFGTAWRILGHAADTEDVVQDVFLEVFRLRAEGDVRSWAGYLRKMAACRALDRLRQKRRPVVSLNGVAQLALQSPAAGPDLLAMGLELSERLREAIAELPEREAEVFCLRYFDDLSYHDIANQLHITAGAVAQALHKARARLETMLGEPNDPERGIDHARPQAKSV